MTSQVEKENLEDKVNSQQNISSKNLNHKAKRPAQTLYIPKHMRNEKQNNTLQANTNTNGSNSVANRSNSPIMNDSSIIGYITDSSKNQPVKVTETTLPTTSCEENILNKLMSLNISSSSLPTNDNIINDHKNEAQVSIPKTSKHFFFKVSRHFLL